MCGYSACHLEGCGDRHLVLAPRKHRHYMNLADLEQIASYAEWRVGDIDDVKAHLPELLRVARRGADVVNGGSVQELAEALKPLQTEDC
jgi:hypothetical protein